ncbi:MAG: hypothetical protein A4E42_01704 [Methanoregulaceae archaeon PtaU1.Bin222]|nr:MAG: hypothetical protein A4E42_01704 [Methanoregulaceae archaeon PtaU1.Bin222]
MPAGASREMRTWKLTARLDPPLRSPAIWGSDNTVTGASPGESVTTISLAVLGRSTGVRVVGYVKVYSRSPLFWMMTGTVTSSPG